MHIISDNIYIFIYINKFVQFNCSNMFSYSLFNMMQRCDVPLWQFKYLIVISESVRHCQAYPAKYDSTL